MPIRQAYEVRLWQACSWNLQRVTAQAPSCTMSTMARSRPRSVPRAQTLLATQSPRRTMFGIGEIIGVITNPSEVLRNLTESKKLLEEARQEMKEQSERAQIPTSHTFSPLPGFYPRNNEQQALERALGGVPAMTILFGASSVGKTALCRQVLSQDRFHCIHFDLRLAGFADLPSLYFSLSTQMESYFASLKDIIGEEWGAEEFEKESWAFKHDRLEIEKRVAGGGQVKTADVAHLLELFQSALLKYWKFEPMTAEKRARLEQEKQDEKEGKDAGTEESDYKTPGKRASPTSTDAKVREGAVPKPAQEGKENNADLLKARSLKEDGEKNAEKETTPLDKEESEVDERKPPQKKIPVLFLDEAHKLPALIRSDETMKTLLDAMLVLTKQDRLAHVVHATSDSFYMHWLRQMNVAQHANLISVGDCSKAEAYAFYKDVLLEHIPDKLKGGVTFDELYRVFGGKLAHLTDYITEYVNSEGTIDPLGSSHYLQAHSLLNLHLIHTMPSRESEEASAGPGFEIYSSLSHVSPHAAPSPFIPSQTTSDPNEQDPAAAAAATATAAAAPIAHSDFTAQDLLLVMNRLAADEEETAPFLPYFPLCREIGARAVDGMVRGRLLELRWTRTVTAEGDEHSALARDRNRKGHGGTITGPVLVPTTPVVRRAMEGVLRELKEEMGELNLGDRFKGKEKGARENRN